MPNAEYCNFAGVTCDGSQHVATVLRDGAALTSIPSQLCGLTSLTSLTLANSTAMAGATIPQCIGSMTSLRSLSLSGLHLGGTLPQSFASLTSLTSLSLFNNQLTGGFPDSIGSLTALVRAALATGCRRGA